MFSRFIRIFYIYVLYIHKKESIKKTMVNKKGKKHNRKRKNEQGMKKRQTNSLSINWGATAYRCTYRPDSKYLFFILLVYIVCNNNIQPHMYTWKYFNWSQKRKYAHTHTYCTHPIYLFYCTVQFVFNTKDNYSPKSRNVLCIAHHK